MKSVIEQAERIVTSEIVMQAEVAVRIAKNAKAHLSPCSCPTCRIHIPNQLEHEAEDWIEMLKGEPGPKDSRLKVTFKPRGNGITDVDISL